MNATVNPTTATTATPGPAERGAAAGAADARGLTGGGNTTPTSNTGGTTGGGTSGNSSDSPGWWDRIKEFFSSFTEEGGIGKVLGGLLGLGGAWLAGNFFGGGIMSTILMVALAIPMMLIGSDSIGGWINGLLGHGQTSRGGDSPERSTTRTVEPARTREELTTKMETIRDELEAYNRVAERRVRAGQLSGVTLESLQRAQAISRRTLDEVASGIPQATNAAEIARIDDVLNGLNRGLEGLLQRNAEIQVEVRTEFNTIRSSRSAGTGNGTTSFTPTMTLNNEEMLAMVNPTNGQPDTNTRDRLEIFVDPNDPSRRLQVRPVDDSVADRPGIITLAALREQVGSSATGIVFGQALNGVVSVQAAPIGALPGAPAAQGRA